MKRIIRRISTVFIIIFCMFFLLFPLYLMFKISLSEPADIFAKNPPYLIHNLTFSHFKAVFKSDTVFLHPLRKSLITALSTSILSLLISVPAAYAIARLGERLKLALIFAIFLTRMLPEVSIALPISISFIRLGLFDSILGLTLAHSIRVLPITCFMLVGVFQSFPLDLEKQARIDGCSRVGALLKVVLPISAGGICVAGLFSFLLSWDEFIYASYLTLASLTMPLKMYYYISRGDIFYSATYAVIITLPVLIITFALQKYLKADYLAGALRG